jgi:hypothetical protein
MSRITSSRSQDTVADSNISAMLSLLSWHVHQDTTCRPSAKWMVLKVVKTNDRSLLSVGKQ